MIPESRMGPYSACGVNLKELAFCSGMSYLFALTNTGFSDGAFNVLRTLYYIAGGLAAVLFLCIAGLSVLVDSEALGRALEDMVSRELGVVCRINGAVDVGVFPRPGISVHDVVLEQPQGFFGDAPLLTAATVRLDFSLSRIGEGVIELGQAAIDRPVIRLVRQADGRSNWQVISAFMGAGRQRQVSSGVWGSIPLRLENARYDGVYIAQGQLFFTDGLRGVSLAAANLDAAFDGGDRRFFTLEADVELTEAAAVQHIALKGELGLDSGGSPAGFVSDVAARGVVTIMGRRLDTALDAAVSYDNASGEFAVSVTRAALDAAVVSGDISVAGALSGTPVVSGRADVEHLSLPFWFEFGQQLPDSLQHALDDLKGSLLFSLDREGLEVSDLRAEVLGMVLRGKGAVSDFSAPVIYIDVAAEHLDVNAVFPELAPVPPATLPVADVSLPPVLVFGPDDAGGVSVGYDIRIAAESFSVWNFSGQGLSFRCWPSEKGTYTSYTVNSFYNGRVHAVLDIRDDFGLKLDVNGVDIATPARLLAGFPAAGGVLAAKADVTADASTIQGLLADLSGRLDVSLASGFFAVRTRREADGRFAMEPSAFRSVDFTLNMQGKSADPDAQRGLMPYAWRLKGTRVASAGVSSAFELDGPVLLEPDTLLPRQIAGARVSVRQKDTVRLPRGDSPLEMFVSGMLGADFETGTLTFRKGRAEVWGEKLFFDVACDDIYGSSPWTGVFSADGLSPSRLVAALWGPDAYRPSDPRVFSRAAVGGSFVYRPEQLELRLDKGVLDRTVFSGALAVSAGRDVFKVDVRADSFDLDRYLPDKGGEEKDEPLDFSFLRDVTLQGSVALDHLVYRNMTYSDVQAGLSAGGGRVAMEPLRATLYDGTVSGMFRGDIKDNGALQSKIAFSFEKVDFGKLTTRFAGDSFVTGVADISFDAEGMIDSSADIPASLDGKWGFVVRDGAYRLRRQEDGGAAPAQYSFSRASATGLLDDGVLRNDDFSLSGQLISMTGKGEVNLPRERINYTAVVSFAGIPSFPVKLTGSMYDPNVRVKHLEILPRTIGNIGGGVFNIIRGVISVPLKAADKLLEKAAPDR